MLWGDLTRRCNYFSSIEGLVVTRLIRKTLDDYLAGGISVWLDYAIIAFELFMNFVDDFQGYQLAFMGLK